MALDFKGDVVSSLAASVTLPRMVRVKQLLLKVQLSTTA